MSEIRTKPVTPEYEEAYDRVFGNKAIAEIRDDSDSVIAVITEK